MGRIEKTVFISYRRVNAPWALAIFQNLTQSGYDVFFDFTGIASGDFESVILENIRARAHFLVLLTPSALERCAEPTDWLGREIETALDSGRNIVPLMLEGFDFSSPAFTNQLSGRLSALKRYNALRVPPEYFSEAMGRLREKFLNVPLEAVLQPPSSFAQETARKHQTLAHNAPEVQDTELQADSSFDPVISEIFERLPASDVCAVRDGGKSTLEGSSDGQQELPETLTSTDPSALKGQVHRATSNVLSGALSQPFSEVIRPQGEVRLPGAGGFFGQQLRSFSLEGFISFASGRTHVAGSANSEVCNTLVTAIVEKLNLFDVVTADTIVARISIDLPRDKNSIPKVSFIGTTFNNLRIGGVEVDLRLQTGVFEHDLTALPKSEPRKGTLVTKVGSSLPSFRNSIDLPGLGTLFLAELLLDGDSYQLNMIRLAASSGYTGSITAVTCQVSVGLLQC